MKQNYLIGLGLIAFGAYLLLVKLHIILAFDFTLLIALAFLGGYLYRRSINERGTTGLLLVGLLLTGLYLSNHLTAWLSFIPGLSWLSLLNTAFYIGLAFLLTWAIESEFGVHAMRGNRGFLIAGLACTFFGSYNAIMAALNFTPEVIRGLFLPAVLVAVGLAMILGHSRKKIV